MIFHEKLKSVTLNDIVFFIIFSLICHRLEEVVMLSLRTADGLSNEVLVIMLSNDSHKKVAKFYYAVQGNFLTFLSLGKF